MNENEKKASGLLHPTQELRQLIIDNPDLPLLIFAGEEANSGGDYSYLSCSYVNASIGEYLDCMQTVNDERCYTDRDEFEEDLGDVLYEDFNGTEQEFEEHLKEAMKEYEPYWTPCIILYVDN